VLSSGVGFSEDAPFDGVANIVRNTEASVVNASSDATGAPRSRRPQ
jgi:hypothetical protein